MDKVKLSQDRSSQVVTGQVKSEIFLDQKYFWTKIVFLSFVSLNLWLPNSLKLNFFWMRKVLDTRLLWPKNFSKRDQVDYLTVDTLSPVGTWRTWNSSVALLSLTCFWFPFYQIWASDNAGTGLKVFSGGWRWWVS